jgi:hypothetical protein
MPDHKTINKGTQLDQHIRIITYITDSYGVTREGLLWVVSSTGRRN